MNNYISPEIYNKCKGMKNEPSIYVCIYVSSVIGHCCDFSSVLAYHMKMAEAIRFDHFDVCTFEPMSRNFTFMES